ncbi:iron ABC transporter permease [Ruegeria sp. Ofav3-42]|uniref:FecCD family ABC transporter permease n=1 Tax=Ruegeria sp. Ofav3-42 TaxID=2917759 RepID=UPI001EF5F891|nr:iron ABC transporter permease [Ruegeria sp. Ofav3-42]MCG7521792.1 iron ABC transporter permease [Ruegeria sp. Ofav3-42]
MRRYKNGLPQRRSGLLLGAGGLLLALGLNLCVGTRWIAPVEMIGALIEFDPDELDHFLLWYQRIPRALIAVYTGAMMACAGVVLQSLMRNPLTSPATLGVNSGATLFVVLGAALWPQLLTPGFLVAQGMTALAGGVFGAVLALTVARLAGLAQDPRGFSLILAGALVAMLLSGVTQAILLSDPQRRSDLLGWASGSINHVYADRLAVFWWIGVICCGTLLALSRHLNLILLGSDKAGSTGVNVPLVSRVAMLASVFAAASAVAVCGPVGFIGLVVPHIARPLLGAAVGPLLLGSALMGAGLCLIADLAARMAFQPYTLHTGVVMDLLGGAFFVAIIRRHYLSGRAGQLA